jgi:hypothetical protein
MLKCVPILIDNADIVLLRACLSRSARGRQASKSGQGWLSRRRQPYCFFRSGTGRSVLSKSDYLLPIGQIARPWPGLGLPVENFYPGFLLVFPGHS